MKPRAGELGVGLAVGAAAGLLADDLDLYKAVSYWGPRVPLLVGAAVLAALLWATRLRRLVAALALGLGLLWLLVAATPLTRTLAEGLVRRDPLREADAIVVLASSIQKDGELSAVSMSRLLHGLQLLGEGRSRRLVVTRLLPPLPSYEPAVRALMAGFHLEAELVVLGPVYNTRDEAAAVKRLFDERGLRTLILVTSPTHTRRAAGTFEKKGLTVIASPSVETHFDLQSLETADDRLRGFGAVVHERIGLLVYRLRGDIG